MTVKERGAKDHFRRTKRREPNDRDRRIRGSDHREPESPARVVEASEFEVERARRPDEVAGGGEVVIAKDGRAVCRLVPAEAPKSAPVGRYRDWFRITGDIVGPIDVEWEAEAHPERVPDPGGPPPRPSSGDAR